MYFSKSVDAVKDILVRGVETGRFKKIDLELTGATLFGLILFIFLSEPVILSMKGIKSLDEAAVMKITGDLVDIFLSGIVRTTPHQR